MCRVHAPPNVLYSIIASILFLESKTHLQKPVDLLAKYNLEQTDIIIMTLTRLAITERNKGYDKVIAAIASLQKNQLLQ